MPINNYESVIVINASLEDEQIDSTYQRVHEFITANGGEFQDVEKWGRKRLAYPIQKSKSGYYFVMRFTAPSDMISKLERTYRLDETIVRFLTVQLDKEAVAHYEVLRNKKEEEAEKSENEVAEKTESAES
ncbi:MAG: 30S ribosomal protein S6 [Melioribacteraceae bacterium]|nr:MAG: 30S ribosomal protein S6 [Melioribacteraceae bacterium]